MRLRAKSRNVSTTLNSLNYSQTWPDRRVNGNFVWSTIPPSQVQIDSRSAAFSRVHFTRDILNWRRLNLSRRRRRRRRRRNIYSACVYRKSLPLVVVCPRSPLTERKRRWSALSTSCRPKGIHLWCADL